MLRFLKERGVYVEMFDSFDLITPEISLELVDLMIDKIWLSCEAATRETYNKIRVGADFDKTVRHVRAFLDIKRKRRALLPELWFHFIINRDNVNEMADYVDFVADLVRDAPNAATLIFFTSLMEFKEVLPLKVWQVPGSIRDEVYRRAHGHGIYINWNENIARDQSPRNCTKWTEPFVLSSGHIQPCCVVNEANARQHQRDTAYINLFEKDFREYWRSPQFKSFLRTLHRNRLPAACRDCKIYTSVRSK